MQRVYFISGLGADKRVFEKLDLSWCDPVFVSWIKPLPKESLSDYAIRIRQQIADSSPTIVGVSFGGMLAAEMLRTDPSIKVILLSSIQNSRQLPGWYRLGKYLPLYRVLPRFLLLPGGMAGQWLFGARSAAARQTFRQIALNTDTDFVRWAIWSILHWKSATDLLPIMHIHGTKDRILPRPAGVTTDIIQDGGHLLPLEYPAIISQLLKKYIL
ncbi:MAG: alpha/beta hydrolase [Chitinophagaceae bacterium]